MATGEQVSTFSMPITVGEGTRARVFGLGISRFLRSLAIPLHPITTEAIWTWYTKALIPWVLHQKKRMCSGYLMVITIASFVMTSRKTMVRVGIIIPMLN